MTVNPENTVAELVTRNFGRVRVFERFGIDYCCGGNISLSEACAKKGLSTGLVQAELDAADRGPQLPGTDWQLAPLGELARFIEQTYHEPLRTEMQRLGELFEHVQQKHGSDHPELQQAVPLFAEMRAQLISHMAEEEAILFPLCERVDKAGSLSLADPELETTLRDEHAEVGLELARLRDIMGDYEPPEGACRKFQALLAGLQQFERDMHEHVHLENNILLPRLAQSTAAALEV